MIAEPSLVKIAMSGRFLAFSSKFFLKSFLLTHLVQPFLSWYKR
jgi:hypothetical protein